MTSKADGGGTVSYGYTADNQVQTVTQPDNTQIALGYTVDGERTSIAFPDGVTEGMTYNPAGQLTKIAGTVNSTGAALTSFAYGYNNASGVPTALRQTVTTASGAITDVYDALNRLTSSGSGYAYGYDAAGNLTSKTINGVQTTYTVNAGNELTNSGYAYDGDGNMTAAPGGTSIAHNSANQATSIDGAAQGYTDVGQSFRTSNGSTTFAYDKTRIGSMAAGGATSYFTRLPDGTLLAERLAGADYYYLTDGNGSVIDLLDSSGNVKDSYAYDPYGNPTAASEPIANPFRFDGAVWDATAKLYKMGERYYDPSSGRWTQMDPLHGCPRKPAELDRYEFANGDPVNYGDPSGLSVCGWVAAPIGTIAGAGLCTVPCVPTLPFYGACVVSCGAAVATASYGIGEGACDPGPQGPYYGDDPSYQPYPGYGDTGGGGSGGGGGILFREF